MELNVENIKALEPGKVYVVEVSPECLEGSFAENLIQFGKDHNIDFLIFPKGFVQVVSAPEGLEVTVTKKSE